MPLPHRALRETWMPITTWKIMVRRAHQAGYHYVATHQRGRAPSVGEQIELAVDSLAQGPQRHQFELSDAVALPVDQGLQSAAIDLEFGAGVVVARFAKPRKSFEPVHRSPRRLFSRRADT